MLLLGVSLSVVKDVYESQIAVHELGRGQARVIQNHAQDDSRAARSNSVTDVAEGSACVVQARILKYADAIGWTFVPR